MYYNQQEQLELTDQALDHFCVPRLNYAMVLWRQGLHLQRELSAIQKRTKELCQDVQRYMRARHLISAVDRWQLWRHSLLRDVAANRNAVVYLDRAWKHKLRHACHVWLEEADRLKMEASRGIDRLRAAQERLHEQSRLLASLESIMQ